MVSHLLMNSLPRTSRIDCSTAHMRPAELMQICRFSTVRLVPAIRGSYRRLNW